MARNEEIARIMQELEGIHMETVFKAFNDASAGIGAALSALHEHKGSMSSGKLCDMLGVSSARVAVLLKTMQDKGLITKEKKASDARVTLVTLTPLGEATIQSMKEKIRQKIGLVIDQVGYERLCEFFAISREIEAVMKPCQGMF